MIAFRLRTICVSSIAISGSSRAISSQEVSLNWRSSLIPSKKIYSFPACLHKYICQTGGLVAVHIPDESQLFRVGDIEGFDRHEPDRFSL